MWLLLPLAFAQTAPAPAAAPAPPAVPAAPPTLAVPRFSKISVGTCGCSLYAPPGLTFGDPSPSEDGSQVWTGEVAFPGVEAGTQWTFGAVVVKFKEPFTDSTADQQEELLVQYMDFLRGQLGIVSNVGVGRGHTLPSSPEARGVIDYWRDATGDDWAVKGWVDKSRLAVLFLAGKGNYPYLTAQQMYLDGFRFE